MPRPKKSSSIYLQVLRNNAAPGPILPHLREAVLDPEQELVEHLEKLELARPVRCRETIKSQLLIPPEISVFRSAPRYDADRMFSRIQDIADFSDQRGGGVGFPKQVHVDVVHVPLGDHFARIAAHEEDFDLREADADDVGQVETVEIGHDHVGQQHVDPVRVFLDEAESILAIDRRDHAVPLRHQADHGQLPDRIVVLDQIKWSPYRMRERPVPGSRMRAAFPLCTGREILKVVPAPCFPPRSALVAR